MPVTVPLADGAARSCLTRSATTRSRPRAVRPARPPTPREGLIVLERRGSLPGERETPDHRARSEIGSRVQSARALRARGRIPGQPDASNSSARRTSASTERRRHRVRSEVNQSSNPEASGTANPSMNSPVTSRAAGRQSRSERCWSSCSTSRWMASAASRICVPSVVYIGLAERAADHPHGFVERVPGRGFGLVPPQQAHQMISGLGSAGASVRGRRATRDSCARAARPRRSRLRPGLPPDPAYDRGSSAGTSGSGRPYQQRPQWEVGPDQSSSTRRDVGTR